MQPVSSRDELRDENQELAPGVHLRITNVPTVVRTGGGEPGVRLYRSIATARHLAHLIELGRIRMTAGETDIVLDFADDASLGRQAYGARVRQAREPRRKRYGRRMRGVPRFGSSDFYYERLRPVGPLAGGENVPS
jgi:hypothetical protein